MTRYTRRQLARAFVRLLTTHSRASAIAMLAQALVLSRLQRDVLLVVQEIGRELYLTQGHLTATVTSAHELTEELKKEIRHLLKVATEAKTVNADFAVHPAHIGGFSATTPVGTINLSVAAQLQSLRTL